jgi:ATP-dependent protease HslVU (ClpYQ) peptidase subunit
LLIKSLPSFSGSSKELIQIHGTLFLEEFSGVVFHADGIVDEYNEGGYPVKQSGMYAVGSGNRFAMGAMMVGATAMEAVEATKKLDVNTGGELQVFIINNGKWKAL